MKSKKRKNMWQPLLAVSVLLLFQNVRFVRADEIPVEISADSEYFEENETDPDETESKKTASGKWKSRNQRCFYYEQGKKVTGLKKIQNNYYYFASNGIQKTGWQKIGDDYYYFKIANGKKGFMETSKTVNGIRLGKKGKAKITSKSEAKLNVLIRANQIVEKAVRAEMKKSEKLQKCFDYLLKQFQYRGSPVFEYSGQWELDYAMDLFESGHGNCYAFGAAFAFLADAAGYQDCYAISSGGHGWAEADCKVYDPTWSLIDKTHSYYGVDYKLSGIDGRPDYKRAQKYVEKI